MKKHLLAFLCLLFAIAAQAQFTRLIVKFRNKAASTFTLANPTAYLSAKAVARRSAQSIAIDSTDLPIPQRYIDSVRLAGNVTILNASKWLNQISIQTSDAAALTKINGLSFVESVSNIAAKTISNNNGKPIADKFELERSFSTSTNLKTVATQDFYNYGNTYNEIHLLNGEFLHNIGMRGQGMLVAVLDAGFYNYTTMKSLDSVNANNQILQTWDFVARETSVTEDDSHGMSCFSTIAGNIPGTFVGNAPKANFVLYRTEDAATEYPIEEHNWVCGMERADSMGVDITSTSLGYTTFDNSTFDHTYADMIGTKNIAARGARIANRKGILSFIAMGNDGNNSWKYLSTPADADSVISVGAVSSSGVVGGFSSYGPSYDGRVKPEAAAPGVNVYVQTSGNSIATGNGTSYATPKMAGLGTCLWQAFPEQNSQTIRTAIINAGSKYTNPDNRVGYGIPDMKKAFIWLLNKYAKINSAAISNCKTTLSWQSKDVSLMKYEIERLTPGQTSYIKIADIQGTGTILANKTVSYTDTLINVQAGTLKYRIKQVIDTSSASLTFTYIDSASFTLTSSCVATAINPINSIEDKISIMPNPVAGQQCTIRIQTNNAIKNLGISLTDHKGSLLKQISTSKSSGTTDIAFSIPNVANGKYYLKLFDNNKLLATKSILIIR